MNGDAAGGNGPNGNGPNGSGGIVPLSPVRGGLTSTALEYQQEAIALKQSTALTEKQIALEKQRIELFRELSGQGGPGYPTYSEAIGALNGGLSSNLLFLGVIGFLVYYFTKKRR